MNRVLKTFLLWLLIAALPMQGLAAAIKASCGATHQNSLQSVALKAHHHHHHGAPAANQHRHDHHDHSASHATAGPDEPVSNAAADEAEAQELRTSAYCSACALCSVGASAPPLSFDWMPSHTSSEIVLNASTTPFTGHIPAGLERPPRHISA